MLLVIFDLIICIAFKCDKQNKSRDLLTTSASRAEALTVFWIFRTRPSRVSIIVNTWPCAVRDTCWTYWCCRAAKYWDAPVSSGSRPRNNGACVGDDVPPAGRDTDVYYGRRFAPRENRPPQPPPPSPTPSTLLFTHPRAPLTATAAGRALTSAMHRHNDIYDNIIIIIMVRMFVHWKSV